MTAFCDGSVRAKCTAIRRKAIGAADATSPQAAEPSSLFQFIARGDPAGGMMYVRFPLSLRNVEDLL